MPDQPATPVEVIGAVKRFGPKMALDGINLSVRAGSFCVLLGPSGSGKTTLLRCIAGIERLSSGRVSVGGRLVAEGSRHLPPEQRDLAMVFQDYALWPHLNALRNVAFALGRRKLGHGQKMKRAEQMLERVGLGHLALRYPNELSGGEQQRVALARALAAGVGLVLFDEPLSNLDADLRERMRIEISTLARSSGATSIYITHDQSEAFALADMIGVLCDGKLVQVGTPEEVYDRPANPFVARFTGLAGELEVMVTGEPGRAATEAAAEASTEAATLVEVRPAGAVTSASVVATVAGERLPAARALLLVRPAGVRLLAPGHSQGQMSALVLDTAYRGRGYDHALLLTDGSRLVGVHDERRWDRGSNVSVQLSPASCLLFDAETTSRRLERAESPDRPEQPANAEQQVTMTGT